MKNLSLNAFVKAWFCIAFLLVATGKIGLAQTLNSQDNNHGNFNFSIDGLASNDLVYYRFSDGYHRTVFQTSENPKASMQRDFTAIGNVKVVAYVARKNGTLDKAQASFTNSNVYVSDVLSGNEVPMIPLPDDGGIKLSTSWKPYTLATSNPIAFSDEAAIGFNSPTDAPWFFLNVTLNMPNNYTGGSANIYFPNTDLEVTGAIVGGKWEALSPNQLNTAIGNGSDFCHSIKYANNQEKVTINLSSGNFGQKNVYLIFKGVPPSIMTLSGVLEEKTEVLSSHEITIKAARNPHDPNFLTAEEGQACAMQPVGDLLTYRVDFQNEGKGDATSVHVKVFFDSSIMTGSSVNVTNSSHLGDLTDVSTDSDYILFKFNGINLPGSGTDYPYFNPFEDTQGFIEFTLNVKPCLNSLYQEFFTTGEIIFFGEDNFTETTPLNEIQQDIKECFVTCLVPSSDIFNVFEVNPFDGGNGSGGGTGIDGPMGINQLDLTAYPTIFNTQLTIEINNVIENEELTIQIHGANGYQWFTQTIFPNFAGSYQEVLNLPSLPTGVYSLLAEQGGNFSTQTIIKQ